MSAATPQGVATVLFLAATAAFLSARRPGPALVTAIAGVAYFSMQRRISDDDPEAGRKINAARYADWILTTPLILFMLLRGFLPGPWLAFVCGADALMIATGYLGVAEERTVEARRAWFALSCAFFVPVLAALVAYIAAAPRRSSGSACALILVVWLAYPVVWWSQYCVTDGLTPVRANQITAALDVVAKVGFGILL